MNIGGPYIPIMATQHTRTFNYREYPPLPKCQTDGREPALHIKVLRGIETKSGSVKNEFSWDHKTLQMLQ